jgi:hypothetical protein
MARPSGDTNTESCRDRIMGDMTCNHEQGRPGTQAALVNFLNVSMQ